MLVSISKRAINFRTYYSEKYDLIQKFCGISEGNFEINNTVDSVEAGLIIRDKWDYWHSDIPLSIANDEAPAMTVNKTHIGANHGFFEAVGLYIPGHDKTLADVGSLWKDEEGMTWKEWCDSKYNVQGWTYVDEGDGWVRTQYEEYVIQVTVDKNGNPNPVGALKVAFHPGVRLNGEPCVIYWETNMMPVAEARELGYPG